MSPSAVPDVIDEVPLVDTRQKPASAAGSSSYVIKEEPIHARRPIRVVCLGAGYSGILMGIIWSQRMQHRNAELVIYERNNNLGGTWFENRYPGCQCDIPAHNYAYSFEPNPEWPNYYATSKQIYDYLEKTAHKYSVEKYIQFRHRIEQAQWDEEIGKWKVQVRSGDRVFVDECDVFINAGGVLNNWKWPNVEGLDQYTGKLIHSADWDESYNFRGKKVAVIGIGSSAIQIIPKLANVTSQLTSFIRSQAWISPAPGINEPTGNDPDIDEDYNYAPHVIESFKSDLKACQGHCRALIDRRLTNFRRTHVTSKEQAMAHELFTRTMKERLGDSPKGRKLAEMLIPTFPVGCRRQTPGPGYLEALVQDHVETRWDDIDRFTENGILTKTGERLEFDAIVCATGFDTTFKPRFPIRGRGGSDLATRWEEEEPTAYFGMVAPEFPNYFMFIGPSSPISNGSLVQGIQMMGIYIWKCIDKLQTEGIKSLEITLEATRDYFEHVQTFLERTVWVGGCRSWYKRGTVDGPVVAIYGGTSFHYIEALRHPRWEDYRIKYHPLGRTMNRFAYLGNGFTSREIKGGSVAHTQTLNFDEYWNLFVLPELYD